MNNRVLISVMCLALPFALVARTISVTASDRQGCVKILFGEAESSATNYLYVAYGPTDGGSDPKNWANFVCEEDVPPEMTETECALPSGWGVSVKAVRYFLTKERFDYAVAYDYIQLNASSAKVGAYFKTDYVPKGNTHVVADYTPQEKGRTTTVFCSRGTSSSAKSYTLFYFSNYFRFDCGNTVGQTKSDTFNYNTRYVVSTGPGLTVSNVATSTSTTYAHDPVSLEAAKPLYLFASHLNGSGFDNIAKGQARYVRVYESDNGTYDATTMVREYIPVLNPTTGKGALYDTVGRTFLEPTRLGCAEGSAQDCSYVGPHMRDFEVIAGTDTIGYSPRTLTVDSVAKESGATKVTLSVSEGALVTDTLVAALGAYDCGPSFSKWPKASVEILAAVSPAAQQMTVTLPSGWGSDYAAARFFLVHSQPVSCDAEKILDDEGQAVSMPVFVSEVKARRLGDIAKIKVTAPDGLTWHVSAVYGETDLGSDPKAWGTNVVIVTDGTGTGSGQVEWTIPAGLVKKQMRFFLSSAAPFETYSHLTGDGTAYLNLGRKGVQGDMVSMSVQYCDYKNSLIFGSREASESKNFTILGYETLYLDYCNCNDSRCTAGSYQPAGLLNHWITFFNSPNLRQIWKDGVSVATDTRAATGNFETPENLYLFSVSGNPPTATSPFAGYIKDFVLQHTDGSVTNDVMRLTPVYDAESEKYAMYDEVSDSIFFNVAASGSFSVDGAASTGKRAYPAYHFVGCSPLMTKGCGLVLLFR